MGGRCILTHQVGSGLVPVGANATFLYFEKEIVMATIVSSEDFKSKVLDEKGPVLVDFFATWCGPCKRVGPIIDEVAEEVKDRAKVYKVDIDQSSDIASRYGVMSVPTLVVFENGEVKKQVIGAQPKAEILQLLS